MIVTVSFKTPDTLDWALEDVDGEMKKNEIKKKLSKWVEYDECVTIEFDTDKMTATVLEA